MTGEMKMEPDREKETRSCALAAEGALLVLVDRLAMRGTISVDEGIEILQLISRGSDLSAARVAQSLSLLSKLRQLRHGDGSTAPGAPASGPVFQ
jgi:hypothetical protein